MQVIAYGLAILGVIIVWEAIKGLRATGAAQAAGASAPASGPSSPAMSLPGSPGGADVEGNVKYLAAWAKSNGLDPRVALYLMAHESHGESMAQGDYTAGQPTSFGPLQIHIPAHGGTPSEWYSIQNDIAEMGQQWLSALKGVSYQQFLSDPSHYTLTAQGGYWIQDNGASADVAQWCQQYGVC